MADALSLLREYNINKRAIQEHDGLIQLGDFQWPKDIKTNYIMWGSGKDGKNDYYTLGSILYLLKNVELHHPQYVRRAANDGVPIVCRPDRKDLLSYLNGESATSQNIDKSAPLDITRQLAPTAPTTQLDKVLSGETAAKKARFDGDVSSNSAAVKTRTRLDELLDGKSTHGNEKALVASGENKSTLSETLSEDKIAAIKAKIARRKKTTTIQPVEDGHDYDAAGDEQQGSDQLRMEILSRERNWRTRSTVLQSGAKSFSKNVFAILSSIKAKEEGKHNQENQAASNFSTSAASTIASRANNMTSLAKKPQAVQHAGYSRYDQERFRGKEETLGFNIDTTGTYHDMSLKSVMEGVATKKIVPSMPKPSLPVMKPTKMIQAKQQKPQKRVSRTPIIIIPAATTSLITLYNAKDLLQDLCFIPTSTKKAQGVKRDNEVLIQRRKDNGATSVPYRVIDNIAKLQTQDDWDRVVAVFVQGPAWQFKGWPWMNGGSPVDIFSKIQAFHVKFLEQKLESNVGKWNVHVMQLSEHKRHMDRAVFYKFWEVLDRYMTKHKSHLRF